jgi:hypothetical protein
LWAALAAPAAVALWGFAQSGVLAQDTWDPGGLRRMLIFAAGFAAWAALFLARPRAFIPAMVVFCAAFTVFAVGPAALLAVCFFIATSLAAGSALTRETAPTHVSILLGVAVYATLIGILAPLPVHYPLTYAVLFAAPVVANRGALLRRARGLLAANRAAASFSGHALTALLAFVLLLHWLVALKPETGADALAMHLAAAARIAADHRWPFEVAHLAWAVMPMNANWCYTGVYLLGGEFAARLLNLAMLLVTVWILVEVAGRVAGLLFASTPLVQLVTGSLMVENFWTALLAASAWCVRERRFLPGAVLGGAAVASKFGAAGFAFPLGAIALYQLGRRRRWRTFTGAVALFLTFAAPPYLNAYLRTGNPVFPFANATFQAPYIDTRVSISDGRFQEPMTWRTLYDLTFFSSRFFEGRNGAAGFQHLLLLPLALAVAARTRNHSALSLAALCAIFVAVTFRAQSNLRYLLPAMAGCAVLIAWALSGLRESAGLHRAAWAGAIAASLLNVCFLPLASWSHRDFYKLSLASASGREEYLTGAAPTRRIVDHLNRESGAGPVAFFETSDIAGLREKAYVNGWHNWVYSRKLLSMRSPLEYLAYAQELGIHRYIAPADLSGGGFAASAAGDFLSHFTSREMVSGWMALYRLRPAFLGAEGFERARAVELIAHTSGPGTYDDTDTRIVFDGAWTFDYHFAEPSNGTIAYAKERGASAAFAFKGTSVSYVYTKAANRGVAEVWIDGAKAADVNLYSPVTHWQATTSFRGLAAGRHEVKIRVTGRRSPDATDNFVDVDAFVIE